MHKTLILLIVSLVMLMEAVDTTIINTSIPAMSISLKVNPIDLKLALISYLLSLAIFIPISGWIADKFGVKKIFMSAIVVFILASIWCGFTNNLWELVVARFVQGIGGSFTMPVGRLIILRTCEKHELISKMTLVVMVASVGMMLGPVLGGFITHYFSWRWIFWVNVPVGILAFLFSYLLLPQMPPRKVHRLDKIGFILFGSGLATLTFGLSGLSESGIADTVSFLIIGLACVLLLYYVWHSRHTRYAIVRISLFDSRTFKISVLGNLLARLGFGGMPFLLPLLFQIGLGYSPWASGLLIAPMALGVFIVKPLSIFILRVLGFKHLLILNTLIISAFIVIFSFINHSTSIYLIIIMTFFYGFLIALQFTGMNSLAYANIEQDDLSAATSIVSTIQQLSQSFGVAVAALFLRFFVVEFSTNSSLTIQVFHYTFIALGICTLFSTLLFFQLKRNDGSELIHRPMRMAQSQNVI